MLLKPRGHSSSLRKGETNNFKLPTRTTVSASMAKRAEPKVKDYMDQLLKMTEKDYPSYNARVDVPFKDGKPEY